MKCDTYTKVVMTALAIGVWALAFKPSGLDARDWDKYQIHSHECVIRGEASGHVYDDGSRSSYPEVFIRDWSDTVVKC